MTGGEGEIASLKQQFEERTAEVSEANRRLQDQARKLQQLEETQRRSQEHFQTLARISPVGIFLADTQGHCRYVNLAWCAMTGLKPEQALGSGWVQALHPEDRERVATAWYQAVVSGQSFLSEHRYQRPDGSITWVIGQRVPEKQPDGQVLGYLGTLTDITDRKRLEERIQRDEQVAQRRAAELASLQDTILDITTEHDLPTLLRIILERAVQLLGAQNGILHLCDPRQQKTRCVVSYNTPRDYTGLVLKYGEGISGTIAQTGQPLLIDDYRTWPGRVRKFDGDQAFVSVIGVPMIWQGQVTGVLTVSHPGSARFTAVDLDLLTLFATHASLAVENTRLLEQVQGHAAQLEETNRQLETFSYSVSHDLRTPLQVILGFANLLKTFYGESLPEEGQEYVALILASTEKMNQLITDLLTYSRLSRGELELAPVSLKAVMAEVLMQLYGALQQSGATVSVAEDLPLVAGHYSAVFQVLQNLVGNAVKYVPKGVSPRVRVWAEVRPADAGRSDLVPSLFSSPSPVQNQTSHVVRLWVEDNGIGIAPKHREHIFQPFERLHKSEYEGSGIGLATVRQAVTRMGGQVGVESTPGRGSRFWIELWQAAEPVEDHVPEGMEQDTRVKAGRNP